MEKSCASHPASMVFVRCVLWPDGLRPLLARMDSASGYTASATGKPMPMIQQGSQLVSVSLLSGDNYAPAMLDLIQAATHSLDLAAFGISSYWPARGSREFDIFTALLNAPALGLRCTAVLATHKRSSATARFNKAASVKLAEAGWQIKWAPQAHLLHAKFIQADKKTTIMGSHNISHTAITSNIDLSAVIRYPSAANEAAQWWNELVSKSKARGDL